MAKRVFKCASCSNVFSLPERAALRCPKCFGKTLILLEGPSLGKGKGGCGGNCAGCSGCHG